MALFSYSTLVLVQVYVYGTMLVLFIRINKEVLRVYCSLPSVSALFLVLYCNAHICSNPTLYSPYYRANSVGGLKLMAGRESR